MKAISNEVLIVIKNLIEMRERRIRAGDKGESTEDDDEYVPGKFGDGEVDDDDFDPDWDPENSDSDQMSHLMYASPLRKICPIGCFYDVLQGKV